MDRHSRIDQNGLLTSFLHTDSCIASRKKKLIAASMESWKVGIETIEALQCLKAWFRAEFYTKEELNQVFLAQEVMERQRVME